MKGHGAEYRTGYGACLYITLGIINFLLIVICMQAVGSERGLTVVETVEQDFYAGSDLTIGPEDLVHLLLFCSSQNIAN